MIGLKIAATGANMAYTRQTTKSGEVLNAVLDKVAKWQADGRTGFCLPVLDGELLEELEALTNERRRDTCTVCGAAVLQPFILDRHLLAPCVYKHT